MPAKIICLSIKINICQKRHATSELSFAHPIPFRRIRMIHQAGAAKAPRAHARVQFDKRFQHTCHGEGNRASSIYGRDQRDVPDLNLTTA